MSMKRPKISLRTLVLLACTPMLLMLSGCPGMAIIAQALPIIVPAQYPGLAGKTTAVMVWTEPQIKNDFPTLPGDIIASLQKKLQDVQVKEEPDDLKGTTFPVTWQSMLRYQSNNPDADTLPIAEVAQEVGVQRLIYIEVS